MNQNVKKDSTGNTDTRNTIKRSRGFIFFMGFLILVLSIYIYSFQSLWVTMFFAGLGISLIGIAMYARKKFIFLIENLMTGWP